MFDIKSIPMIVEAGANGTIITVQPADLYPAIIARIQEVLAGANPFELLASSERGGSARADILINNARGLSAEAWKDALRPRNEFCEVGYFSMVERNGGVKESMLNALAPKMLTDVQRMIARGNALEIAMGWFVHAVRLEFGSNNLTITRDENYRL